MISFRGSSHLLIIASFLVALVVSVYPLPLGWRWWRPEFVLVVAIYWMMVFPETISLFFLAAVGLFQDLLESVPLGQHSLSLIVVAYICIQSYQRVRNFALWKETVWVIVLVGVAQLSNSWVQGMAGRPLPGLIFLAPALVSALLWPVTRIGFDWLSSRYRID